MKFRINQLILNCKKAREVIPFTQFNYYYEQMGAGKSSLARLIDFCLGGSRGKCQDAARCILHR